MECPKCGYEIDERTTVCPNCKKVLKVVCPVCKTINKTNTCKKLRVSKIVREKLKPEINKRIVGRSGNGCRG